MHKDLKKCKTLDELLDLLQKHNALDENSGWTKYELDLCNLPKFGGNEPDDTAGIWSWDKNRLLIGESANFKIVSRASYNER